MKRFNQYLNGEREPKNPNPDPIDIKNDTVIKYAENKKQYKDFLKTLDKEASQLKDLIYNSLIGRGLFIDDTMTKEQRLEIKEEVKCEVIELDTPPNGRCHYKCNILD